MAGGRRPTIEAVTAGTRVGRRTVSRVIDGSEPAQNRLGTGQFRGVHRGPGGRRRVPHAVARGPVTSRTDAIVLIVPEPARRLAPEP